MYGTSLYKVVFGQEPNYNTHVMNMPLSNSDSEIAKEDSISVSRTSASDAAKEVRIEPTCSLYFPYTIFPSIIILLML